MPKYIISYNFEGYGKVEIEARSKAHAENKWNDGDYKEEEETTQDYSIDDITRQ